ncbi:sigma factor-like helix-turn-helix DNA-binding protein [Runella sp. SP2]|uniref:helix-turn-helix transcriptional regulator n=1 Tax=Runella sp. SP2 TaxID=2268026 RepID=UPI000F077AC7|nr:sigma factor-like helix-turn-helix DNA-binding protein [Runella sp. SP2]AYQ34944.1 helix-turn-helix domain-containing protein [Runella sp. SP2]
MKSKSTKQVTPQERAFRYYVMGLNCQEIGKLLDLSTRTIERYMQLGEWKEQTTGKNVEAKAYDLHEGGKTYAEIAQMLQVSKGTVFNYMKRYKAKEGLL